MDRFNFLKEYIEQLPEEERSNFYPGFVLREGKSSLEIDRLESYAGISVPSELKEFYEFSYGAELGEYKILNISELVNHLSVLRLRYEENWVDAILPFAYIRGVGDLVAFDLNKSDEAGHFLIVDGFHEVHPNQWKGICFGLRMWLIKMTENKFKQFWL